MDFLRVADLDPSGLTEVVELADGVKKDPASVAGRLQGLRVGLFFEKPSNRTRVSTEVATTELGGIPIVLRGEEVGLGRREAVEDVARVLDRYLDVLAFRVFSHDDLTTLADYSEAPVINLLSELEHPCQALADLQTIGEHRPLPGTVVAYVGDGNNVCQSLMVAAAMTGMTVRVATPAGFEPDPAYRKRAAELAAASGGSVLITADADEAVTGADVVYTDVWASMGEEQEADERRAKFAAYQIDEARFARADGGAIFLHCLPAHRDEEVASAVIEHSRSRVFEQAENRLHTFKALLLYLNQGR
ncbi:MAG: ornithine carbamoyltransferase [Acidimicrobiia bacterium]